MKLDESAKVENIGKIRPLDACFAFPWRATRDFSHFSYFVFLSDFNS